MAALTKKQIPDTHPQMGRPPLKDSVPTHKMLLRMPEDLRARIEAVAGKGNVAAFIRDAAETEVARREAETVTPRSPKD